jgi:curved DNA-binding protein CbpA
MPATCYDVLAVGPDATDEEIETAFRRRARETHPDVSDHDEATDRFRLLARSRTTLLDAERRARYDRLGHDQYAAQAWSEEFTTTWLAVTDEWIADMDTGSDVDQPDTADDRTTTDPALATDRREAADDAETDADRTGPTTARAGGTDSTRAGGTDSARAGGTGRTTASVDDASLWETGSSWVDADRDAGRGDSEDGGFAVRNVEPTADDTRISVGRPDETELLFAVALFIGYPFFLFGSVAPAFPLVINATLGSLTLLLVGAALIRPAVGLGVFGAWSVVAPVVVVFWNLDVAAGAVVLPVVVGTCWLPFAVALLVAFEFG